MIDKGENGEIQREGPRQADWIGSQAGRVKDGY